MVFPLETGDDDPWAVSLTSLTLATDQPSGHASCDVPGGRIDAQRYGDGVTVPYHAYIRFFGDPDLVQAPRWPTMEEVLEASDRLFPRGHVIALPMFVAGSAGERRMPKDGEPIQVLCHGPAHQPGGAGRANGRGLRLEA